MRKFSMPLAALATIAFAGSVQPADLDAVQVQQQQAQERDRQQATDSIEGTIAERENGTFVVQTRDGERISFHTNDRTRVDDPQGRSLQALGSGESILVHYRAIATRVQARETQREMDPQEREAREQMERGQQQERFDSIRGTLGQRENGSFTVVTDSGERKTFHLEDPEAPMQEREQAQVRQQVDQLDEGEAVTVHFRAVATSIEVRSDAQRTDPQERQPQERDPVQQERERPQQPQQDRDRQQPTRSIEGTVAERENGTLVITTARGERINVHTDEQTRVGVWQERNLDALGAGESVVVEYRAIATRVELREGAREMDPQERQRREQAYPGGQDQATDSIQGTLAQRENGAFSVVTQTGERMTFHLEDRTRQTDPRQPAPARQQLDLDRFEEGQSVTVHFRAVATTVEVRQDGQPRQDVRQTDPQQRRQDQQRQDQQRQERPPVQQQARDRQQATDSIEGTIAERENGTFVVVTREGERMSFEIDDQARTGDPLERNVEQLRSGQPVVVHYRAIATRVEPADGAREMDPQQRERTERERQQQMERGQQQDHATDSIQGTLAERENGAFTIVTRAGERKTFHLDDRDHQPQQRQMEERVQTRQQVDLDRFEEGQALIVHFRAVATSIEQRDEPR